MRNAAAKVTRYDVVHRSIATASTRNDRHAPSRERPLSTVSTSPVPHQPPSDAYYSQPSGAAVTPYYSRPLGTTAVTPYYVQPSSTTVIAPYYAQQSAVITPMAYTMTPNRPPEPQAPSVSVTRSQAGLNGGVWFLNYASGEVVVLKQCNNYGQLAAARFLRRMGLSAPDLRLFEKDGPEGLSVVGLLGPQPAYSASRQRDFKYFSSMRFVEGASLTDLASGTRTFEYESPNLFPDLGRMVIYDLLMKNDDRLNLRESNRNLGNIMVTQDGVLTPIDQEFGEHDGDSIRFAQKVLEHMLDDPQSDKYAQKVVTLLTYGGKDPLKILTRFQTVQRGIDYGMRDAMNTFLSKSFRLKEKELVPGRTATAINNLRNVVLQKA